MNNQLERPMDAMANQDVVEAQVVNLIAPAPGEKMTLASVQAQLAGKTGNRFSKNL
jgi:hypothetical protein